MANLFDSINYPTREPAVLTVGDRWAWKRADLGVDYPPASYTLSYEALLEGGAGGKIAFSASASGTDFLIEIAAATTADYASGRYHWQAFITRDSDGERIKIDRGTWELKPDFSAESVDPRSHVKKVLDALEALIEGKATKDQLSYTTVGGRSIERMSPAEVIEWYQQYKLWYKQEQRDERIANGHGNPRRIGLRIRRG